MSIPVGTSIAGYRILRLIGSGGMAEVYLAEHPRLPRRDALKVLSEAITADTNFRARFHREADLAATLWHPNIVAVHDRGEFESQLWISMDYVDGTDAGELLKNRYPAGLPMQDVCGVVIAVADALDYAHEHGLLHRDVKPANILLAEPNGGTRRILLADFGIARPIVDVSGLTVTNFTVGTLAYAAPEQLMGADIDGRADQYALAATAFHLLNGAPPYQHSNPVAVISRHLTAPPPKLSDQHPELAHLDDVLSRALAKDPSDRFDKCRDFAEALSQHAHLDIGSAHGTEAVGTVAAPIAGLTTQIAALKPNTTPAPKRRKRSRILVGAAVAAVLVTAVGIVGYVLHPARRTASTPAASPAVQPTAELDGTFQFTYDYEKQTINGAPFAVHTTENTAWWAFHTSCGSTGCTATATQLDTNNHRVGHTPPESANYRFAEGRWQSTPVQRQLAQPRCLGPNGQVSAGANTVLMSWSFEPQPDATLRGLKTGTALTNECGFQGQVAVAPVLATRVGDVPAGVRLADSAPASVAPPAPHVAGPVLDGTYRVDFDLEHQTINGSVTGLPTAVSQWWAFRSACTSAGCAAAGSELAESNQEEGTGTTSVLHFVDGHWQGTPILQAPMQCDGTTQPLKDDETRLWSFDPQAGSTVRGLEVGTILSDECGNQGTVYRTPFVATRTGDVAPSVIVADPTLFVGQR